MRLLFLLVLLGAVAYAGWPYYELMQLDRAVIHDDERALSELVDIDSVRRNIEASWAPARAEGQEGPGQWLAKGMQTLSADVVKRTVTLPWFRETVLERITGSDEDSLLPGVDFACFEGPTRFLVRYGKLGEQPLHLYMDLSLREWGWRVRAVYPP